MIKITETSKSFQIDVSCDIWDILSGIDSEGNDNDEWIIHDLEKFGAYSINWNGHFGMAIFLSLDSDDYKNIHKIELYLKNLVEL